MTPIATDPTRINFRAESPDDRRPLLRGVAVLLLTTFALVLAGCAQPRPDGTVEEVLDTEDVDAGPTANMIPLEDEAVDGSPTDQLSGLIPEDFPGDLPVYLPSSVADFGIVSEAVRYLELRTPDDRDAVLDEISRRWAQQGWRASGGGSFANSGRTVTLSVTDQGTADTRIRIEYPAQIKR